MCGQPSWLSRLTAALTSARWVNASMVPLVLIRAIVTEFFDHTMVGDRRMACTAHRSDVPLLTTRRTPSRSRRWSPTRSALAIVVSPGLTVLRGRQETGVDEVRIVEIMCLAVDIQR